MYSDGFSYVRVHRKAENLKTDSLKTQTLRSLRGSS